MLQPQVSRTPRRPWTSLALSAAVHAALLVVAVELSRREPGAPSGRTPASQAERQVDLVYLPPLPPSPPPPAAPPPAERPRAEPPPRPEQPPERPREPVTPPRAPPPEREQPAPEPEPNAPPEAERREGVGDAEGGETAGAAEGGAVTMESEARRIFGRARPVTPPGAGPRATRPMEAVMPEDPSKCIPRPVAPRDSAAPAQFGVAEGRILRGDTGEPLPGAHLHMLGTPYVTFTDDEGAYRFRFDLSLVDNCRTQYVRVTAKGYESQLLVLLVGASVRSDDVRLRKRSWWR